MQPFVKLFIVAASLLPFSSNTNSSSSSQCINSINMISSLSLRSRSRFLNKLASLQPSTMMTNTAIQTSPRKLLWFLLRPIAAPKSHIEVRNLITTKRRPLSQTQLSYFSMKCCRRVLALRHKKALLSVRHHEVALALLVILSRILSQINLLKK